MCILSECIEYPTCGVQKGRAGHGRAWQGRRGGGRGEGWVGWEGWEVEGERRGTGGHERTGLEAQVWQYLCALASLRRTVV